ncbi:hypothetical protein [Thiohalophilus sp.]|uniref:hypothetical protein n=1 Tax=Thiohalophilus sp. TaxID=3028392 RepID=UPI002ACE7C82|nr:hypothetical protein [Thiohalophilus sp.]MDZ7803247.1 hypothetical protein [Thiohalophilus sp.]
MRHAQCFAHFVGGGNTADAGAQYHDMCHGESPEGIPVFILAHKTKEIDENQLWRDWLLSCSTAIDV